MKNKIQKLLMQSVYQNDFSHTEVVTPPGNQQIMEKVNEIIKFVNIEFANKEKIDSREQVMNRIKQMSTEDIIKSLKTIK